MNALIIEDEKAAIRNLKAVLEQVAPDMEIIGEIDSVVDSIEWFHTHEMPGLVFMDIHLADGSAFEVFDHVDITCPIIFTTAYDEYALRAFKVNSIDYLLKPIGEKELEHRLSKLLLLGSKGTTGTQASFMELFEGDEEKVKKLLEFAGIHRDVADPWYTGDFEVTRLDVETGCTALLSYLKKELL